jgi:cell division protein FtsL
MKKNIFASILSIAVLASLVEIVVHRHQSRQLFVESQKLQGEVVELGREWGRLLLEQGTLATHGRIEELARDRLDMALPERKNVLVIGSR